jgi:hypothetical protein
VVTVDLQELVEFGFRRVTKLLLRPRGELTPFFVLVSPTGEREVVETPYRHLCEPMRELMRANGTVAYAFFGEAGRPHHRLTGSRASLSPFGRANIPTGSKS